MKLSAKRVVLTLAIAVISSFMVPQTAAAASPITIEGVVYDKHNTPVPGVTVVAWCGDITFFGGSDATDANGYYHITTNSDDCPFANELTVTTDVDNDGGSDGATHTQVHTSTYISIHLGDYASVVIPEYDWIGAGIAVLAGVGVIGFVRRRANSKLSVS